MQREFTEDAKVTAEPVTESSFRLQEWMNSGASPKLSDSAASSDVSTSLPSFSLSNAKMLLNKLENEKLKSNETDLFSEKSFNGQCRCMNNNDWGKPSWMKNEKPSSLFDDIKDTKQPLLWDRWDLLRNKIRPDVLYFNQTKNSWTENAFLERAPESKDSNTSRSSAEEKPNYQLKPKSSRFKPMSTCGNQGGEPNGHSQGHPGPSRPPDASSYFPATGGGGGGTYPGHEAPVWPVKPASPR